MKAKSFRLFPALLLAACATTAGGDADGGALADGGEVSGPGRAMATRVHVASPQPARRSAVPLMAENSHLDEQFAMQSPWVRATVTNAIHGGGETVRALQWTLQAGLTGGKVLAAEVAAQVAGLQAVASTHADAEATLSFLTEAAGAAVLRGVEADFRRSAAISEAMMAVAGAMCGDGQPEPCDAPVEQKHAPGYSPDEYLYWAGESGSDRYSPIVPGNK